MTNKIKNYVYLGLLLVIISLTGFVVFESTYKDSKGAEKVSRVAKDVYYKAARVIPINPAIKLVVPYHRQEHALSCEVASLWMALNYKGIKVTEDELIQQLPISDAGPRSKDNIWGDPDLGFVGNIDGRMPNTGYGVYEQPIYDLATKYRSAKIINNATIENLLTELTNKNPVVVWGFSGSVKSIAWKTPEGQTINAKMGEHTRVLIGFTGQSNNPKLMILLDPIYGEIRMKVADFINNWGKLENRAVVIY